MCSSFIISLAPPEIVIHRIYRKANSIRNPEAAHGVNWYRLGDRFD